MTKAVKIATIVAGVTAGAIASKFLLKNWNILSKTESGETNNSQSSGILCGIESIKNVLTNLVSSKKEDFETGLNSLVDKAEDKKDDIIQLLERKLSEVKRNTSHMADKARNAISGTSQNS